MGELLRKIGSIDINGCKFDVELNAPPARDSGRSIHIQSKSFRFELPEEDFYQMAGAILESNRQFEWIKGESKQKHAHIAEETK